MNLLKREGKVLVIDEETNYVFSLNEKLYDFLDEVKDDIKVSEDKNGVVKLKIPNLEYALLDTTANELNESASEIIKLKHSITKSRKKDFIDNIKINKGEYNNMYYTVSVSFPKPKEGKTSNNFFENFITKNLKPMFKGQKFNNSDEIINVIKQFMEKYSTGSSYWEVQQNRNHNESYVLYNQYIKHFEDEEKIFNRIVFINVYSNEE